MEKKIELLAPGGDIDSIKAAILAGADAVYCGLDKFNARNRAENIGFDDLQGVLRLAHQYNCAVFLTLNILMVEREIPALIGLLNKLVNTRIDGIIVQDLGLFYLLNNYFKGLKIHASTQFTTHNEGQIQFLGHLNATRVNLSRELNRKEIKVLTWVSHQHNLCTEVFVHGSFCLSFSGLCYMSSVQSGNSGNRGRCSQPCRDRYLTTAAGKDYPLNLKDNSAYPDLKELIDTGVDSLKVEGRIKKSDYVYTVVKSWKKLLQSFYDKNEIHPDDRELYKVFNRDFSNSFLKGVIHQDMFIDNSRDHSVQHLSEVNDYATADRQEEGALQFYQEKEAMKAFVAEKISRLSIAKVPVVLHISGEYGTPLKVRVHTPDTSFGVCSEMNLANSGSEAINYAVIFKRLKAINETEYFIEQLILEDLQADVYLSFKELTAIKKRVLFILNGSKAYVDPIEVPVLKKHNQLKVKPSLSVLISSVDDLDLFNQTTAERYFQLPECLNDRSVELTGLFTNNKTLIPWFPAILIGDDYLAALNFLDLIRPKLIVTNNTGIAFEAFKRGIKWIAGPYLNLVNSYSLICLKERFNCSGAFISNEISKLQIQQIIQPEGFDLYYSICHPIVLMTSRQCLFHQVTGCEKSKIDNTCLQNCEKSGAITNLKQERFLIEKTRGNYHCIYHETSFLNTDILTDLPGRFAGFLIDLREIKTETRFYLDKPGLIRLFENLMNGHPDAAEQLRKVIHPTTCDQYNRGI